MRYISLLLFFIIIVSHTLKVCSDNLNVELLGRYSFSGRVIDVYVVNDYAYICTGTSLISLDVSKPSNPFELGRVDTVNSTGVCVDGDYAYVADKTGLKIIDISDPKNPRIVATYHTNYSALGVYVSGHYAYLVDTDVLHIIDVSDPKNPNRVGSCIPPGYGIGGICVSGSYAYVTRGGKPIFDDKGFRIVFLTNPEGKMYCGLAILDISNPIEPKSVGFYYSSDPRGVYVIGNHAYLSGWLTGMDAGLQIVDVSDKIVPKKVGSIVTPGVSDEVHVIGKYAYLADGRKFGKPYSGLRVIDVSDPDSPREIGFYDTPYINSDAYNIYIGAKAYGIYAIGNHAYLADGNGGLCILRCTGENAIKCPWDVNKDGLVDIVDLVIVGQHFGEKVMLPAPEPNPDINNDGMVDILDLVLVGQHFGETCSAITW